VCGNDTFVTQLNAKELILAKINAGTNFAKMYIYLITMGYNLNDIAAFMVCPVAEFIDRKASSNIFQEENGNPYIAINLASGKVSSSYFLHGSISFYDKDTEETITMSKKQSVLSTLHHFISSNPAIAENIMASLNLERSELKTLDLDSLMQEIILTLIDLKDVGSLQSLTGKFSDIEINNYLKTCHELVLQLREVNTKYNGNKQELLEDVKEFKKIFSMASEISTVTTGFLSLNQGLPTAKLDIIKRLNTMKKAISDRERYFDINGFDLFEPPQNVKQTAAQQALWAKTIESIRKNNSLLTEEEIR